MLQGKLNRLCYVVQINLYTHWPIYTWILRLALRVGWPLWNTSNRFTDDIGYVPYIVTTIHFPFHHEYDLPNCLFTGFVITWATRRVPHLKQDLITLPEHLRSPLAFGGVRVAKVFSFLCCVLCTTICLFVFFIF